MVNADPILKLLLDHLPDDLYISVSSLTDRLGQNVPGYLRRTGVKDTLANVFGMHVKRDRAPGGPKESFVVYSGPGMPPPEARNISFQDALGTDADLVRDQNQQDERWLRLRLRATDRKRAARAADDEGDPVMAEGDPGDGIRERPDSTRVPVKTPTKQRRDGGGEDYTLSVVSSPSSSSIEAPAGERRSVRVMDRYLAEEVAQRAALDLQLVDARSKAVELESSNAALLARNAELEQQLSDARADLAHVRVEATDQLQAAEARRVSELEESACKAVAEMDRFVRRAAAASARAKDDVKQQMDKVIDEISRRAKSARDKLYKIQAKPRGLAAAGGNVGYNLDCFEINDNGTWVQQSWYAKASQVFDGVYLLLAIPMETSKHPS